MDPARWQHVSRTFHRVQAAPVPARAALLAELCGGDAELAREVTSLLAAQAAAPAFLERPALEARDGERIGAWRVVRELGSGGMGTVFLVERDDGGFQQQAAAKVLKAPIWADEFVARFCDERQVLARLGHPAIARLLDGGQTGGGQPYFVMEYVAGRPIDAFCGEERLGLRERIALFLQVCSAVDHAHRNLVVHRDLKPANVLVFRDAAGVPQPKLLDFGIAKTLLPAAATPENTSTRWMTPEYASPEQLRGAPVTTASDVYSLGVLLYRILTGSTPYDVPPGDLDALEQAVRNGEPVPLRRRLAAGDREARASGADLERVLAMALQKEPLRRYPSVEQFAADLERVLARRPVRARADSLAYRAERLLRRNPALVALAAVLLLTGLAGVLGVLWQSHEARAEARRVVRINDFLGGLLQWPDPDQAGRSLPFAEAVARVADRIDAEFADDAAIAAALHCQVGGTLHHLGKAAAGRSHLERAAALLDTAGSADWRLRSNVLLRLADVDTDQGQWPLAEQNARAALHILEARVPADDALLAETLSMLGLVLVEQDRPEDALPLLERARDALAAGHDARAVVRNWNALGLAREGAGDRKGAEAAFRTSIDLARELPADHPAAANPRINLGRLLFQDGRFEPSKQILEEALTICRTAYGNQHLEVAQCLNQLAGTLVNMNQLDAADARFTEALAICKADGTRSGELLRLQALTDLARLRSRARAFAVAEDLAREALVGYRALFPESHHWVRAARMNLARSLLDRGSWQEARELLESVLAELEASGEGGSELAGDVLWELGGAHLGAGRAAEAEAAYARALRVRRAAHPETDWRVSVSQLGLTEALVEQDRCADAAPEAKVAYDKLLAQFGSPSAITGLAATVHAHCLAAAGDTASAAPLFTSGVATLRKARGDCHPWTRRGLARHAAFLEHTGDAAGAAALREVLAAGTASAR